MQTTWPNITPLQKQGPNQTVRQDELTPHSLIVLPLQVIYTVVIGMANPETELRRAWMTAGHSELWNCRGTYCTVPYEYLPRLDRATNDLAWLDDVSAQLRQVIDSTSTLDSSDNEIGNLESILAQARELALSVPESFVRFLRTPELQEKVPTCSACFLALSEDLVPVPARTGSYLLRFLNDSQSCVMWYLRLGGTAEPEVLASDYFLEPDIFEAMDYENVRHKDAFEAFTCAGTFVEFLYRFWIENTIWYSLHNRVPLTSRQEEYEIKLQKSYNNRAALDAAMPLLFML